MNLLIDCGNTRIKWALSGPSGIVEQGSEQHQQRRTDAIAAVAAVAGAGIERAVVASVVSDAFTGELLEALTAASVPAARVRVAPAAFGLRIAYRDPEALGVDRWLSMIAGCEDRSAPLCVVNAGTAVTFDAVDADGSHLGGFIWPGPGIVAAALERNTDRIGPTPRASTAPPGLAALGRDTAGAVGFGSLFAIGAAIDRAVRIVAEGCEAEPDLLLAGGDAELLAPWLRTSAAIEPDLVLHGLAIVATAIE